MIGFRVSKDGVFGYGYLQIQGLVVVVDLKMGIAMGVSLWVFDLGLGFVLSGYLQVGF